MNSHFLFSAFMRTNECGQPFLAHIPPGSLWANPPLFQEDLAPSPAAHTIPEEENGHLSIDGPANAVVASQISFPSSVEEKEEEWWMPLLAGSIHQHKRARVPRPDEKEELELLSFKPAEMSPPETREEEMRALGLHLLLQEGGFDRPELSTFSAREDIAEPQEKQLNQIFMRWSNLIRPYARAWHQYRSLHGIHPLEEKAPQFRLFGDVVFWSCWMRMIQHLNPCHEQEYFSSVLARDINIFRHVERLWNISDHHIAVVGTLPRISY